MNGSGREYALVTLGEGSIIPDGARLVGVDEYEHSVTVEVELSKSALPVETRIKKVCAEFRESADVRDVWIIRS